jgi:hypothetical protein
MTAPSTSRQPSVLSSERPPPGPSSWRTWTSSLRFSRGSHTCVLPDQNMNTHMCQCSDPLLSSSSYKTLPHGPKKPIGRLKGSPSHHKRLKDVLTSTKGSPLEKTDHSANELAQTDDKISECLHLETVFAKEDIFYYFLIPLSIPQRSLASFYSRLASLTRYCNFVT